MNIRSHTLTLVVLILATILFSPSVAEAKKTNSPESQTSFGIKMYEMGMVSEAMFRFKRAEELSPNHAGVLNNLAVIYETVGNDNRALEYYNRALELDPTNKHIRDNYKSFIARYNEKNQGEEAPSVKSFGEKETKGLTGWSKKKLPVFIPIPAIVDTRGKRTIAIAKPIVLFEQKKQFPEDFNPETEVANHLKRIIEKHTKLDASVFMDLKYSADIIIHDIPRYSEFWKTIGERSGADLVLFTAIDLSAFRNAGYKSDKYISPIDDRAYTRQTFTDRAGFELDIYFYVFDGKTGELLYSGNLRSYREMKEGEGKGPARGLLHGLSEVENGVLGMFTTRENKEVRIFLVP